MRTTVLLLAIALFCNCAIAAETVHSGQTLIGKITAAGQSNKFELQGMAGERLLAVVTATTDNFGPFIELYPPNGGEKEASAAYGGHSSTLDCRFDQTGAYTLVVRDFGNNAAGDYKLTLLDLSSPGELNQGTLNSGETKIGNIHQISSMNVFQLKGIVGERLLAVVTATTDNFGPFIELYPPNGGDKEASAAYGGHSSTLDCRFAQTGAYTLVVRDFGNNAAGDYKLTLLDLSSPGELNLGTLTSGETKIGKIHQISSMNVFQIKGTAGERMQAVVTATTDNFGPFIELYPPNGGEKEASAAYGGHSSTLDCRFAQTGAYTLVVRDFGNNAAGDYKLTLLDLSSPGELNLGTLTFGETKTGKIHDISSLNLFHIQGTAGERMLAVVTATTDNFGPFLELYPPNGGAKEASAAYGGHSSTLDCRFAQTGAYTLIVRDFGNNAAGGYTISLHEK